MSYKPHLSRPFFIVVDLILQATEPKVKLDLVLITTVSWNSSTTTFLYVFSYGLSKQGMYKTNPSLQFCAKILRNTQSKSYHLLSIRWSLILCNMPLWATSNIWGYTVHCVCLQMVSIAILWVSSSLIMLFLQCNNNANQSRLSPHLLFLGRAFGVGMDHCKFGSMKCCSWFPILYFYI